MKEMAFEHKRMSWLSIGRKGEVRVRGKNVNQAAEGAEWRHGGLKLPCRSSQSRGWE